MSLFTLGLLLSLLRPELHSLKDSNTKHRLKLRYLQPGCIMDMAVGVLVRVGWGVMTPACWLPMLAPHAGSPCCRLAKRLACLQWSHNDTFQTFV
jgi:hypothetical protein